MSYGSYPETHDDPKAGYSFAFLRALPAAAGRLTRAHELSLELDDTSDVPVRSSDLYLSALLADDARTRGIPLAELVDDLLRRSAFDEGSGSDTARLLGRVSRRFGLGIDTYRRAAVVRVATSLQNLPALLTRLVDDLTASLGEMNAAQFRSFLVSRSEWRASIEPAKLTAIDPAERMVLGNKLASELALFSRNADTERERQAQEVQNELVKIRQLVFRVRVRLAGLLRMASLLDSIAGRVYLAQHPQQQAGLQRLLDCEALDLILPVAEWTELVPSLPPADEDIAETNRVVTWASERGLLRPSPVSLGQSAPELGLTPYRGAIPTAGSGKPILLFFWATSCQQCRNVVLQVADIARRKRATVLAITDESEATLDSFFAHRRDLPWPIGRDPERHVISRFGIHELPAFVLIDGHGTIASPAVRNVQDLPLSWPTELANPHGGTDLVGAQKSEDRSRKMDRDEARPADAFPGRRRREP